MNKLPFFSIIIPVKHNNKYLTECIEKCLRLDYSFFEIIVLPDENISLETNSRLKVVATGSILPAAKRDIGAEQSTGEILVFLDDDAFPVAEWLRYAALDFNDNEVVCVCGPAVTPKDDSLLSLASGKIYESLIVSGPAQFRYLPLTKRYVDDAASCNFFIKKNIFQEIGGFKTKFWPGEDTILCLEVAHRLKKKILYDPMIMTYHHRRPLFRPHIKQVANYALHRGYFVKRYPRTSLRIGYFMPSMIILTLLASFVFSVFFNRNFLFVPLTYLLFVFIFSCGKSKIQLWKYVFLGIVATHLAYGLNFIKGLMSTKLKEE